MLGLGQFTEESLHDRRLAQGVTSPSSVPSTPRTSRGLPVCRPAKTPCLSRTQPPKRASKWGGVAGLRARAGGRVCPVWLAMRHSPPASSSSRRPRPAIRAFVSHWSVVSRPSERTDEPCPGRGHGRSEVHGGAGLWASRGKGRPARVASFGCLVLPPASTGAGDLGRHADRVQRVGSDGGGCSPEDLLAAGDGV